MRFLIAPAIWFARGLYALMRLLPRQHKIVMLSRQSDRPSNDFAELARELSATDPTLQIVIRCRFIQPGLLARIAYAGEVLTQMYHLATSRACVVDGYIVPVSVLAHDDRLFVLQMWHALGAVKQFGYQSLGRPGGRSVEVARAMRMHRNYDVVVCGGPGAVPAFSAAFDVDPSIVAPLGLPTVDLLRDSEKRRRAGGAPSEAIAELSARSPRLTDRSKTVVLYAPTFRKTGEVAYRDLIAALDPDRFTLVIKPHDLESTEVSGEHVVNASGVPVTELLVECDAVVTDYSAVAFEALSIDRRVYFWVYDIEEYRQSQGLNVDPLEVLPEVSSPDVARVADMLESSDYPAEAVSSFAHDYVPLPGYQCTREIAKLVLSHLD